MEKLYIENVSNTEFVYEKDIYAYLMKLKRLLEKYNSFVDTKSENEKYDPWGILHLWQLHMKDLSVELFNSFAEGNYLTAMAMTRTLMECYVFVKIMKMEENKELIFEWYLCGIIHKVMEDESCCAAQVKKAIKEFCDLNKLDYNEKWQYYAVENQNSNAWIKKILGNSLGGFSSLCQHINEKNIYKDYERACEFVHGQDITTKMTPFWLYENIFDVLYLVVTYILKSIRLFDIDGEIEEQIIEVESDLAILKEVYMAFGTCLGSVEKICGI